MKKVSILFIFVLFVTFVSTAQDYKTALGVRGGVMQAVTFKQFISQNAALELLGGVRRNKMNVTLLYEIHSYNMFGVSNLSLFYGLGGHVGHYYFPRDDEKMLESLGDVFAFGGDLIIGMEYKIPNVPINFGVDFKPAFNIYPRYRYRQGAAGFVRYVF